MFKKVIQQGRRAFGARGAYTEYVSTPKARERSWPVCRSLGEGWRPFSTFPEKDRKIWPHPTHPQ